MMTFVRLMQAVACVFLLLAGPSAHADAPIQVAQVQPGSDPGVTLVKKGRAAARSSNEGTSSSSSSSKPLLSGDAAWLVAGGAGALFTLVLFAIPVLFFGFAIPFLGPLVLAVLWGGIVGAGAGGIAWLIQQLWSEMRSGFLLPVIVSGATVAGITLIAGVLSTLVWWMGAVVGFILYPYGWNPFTPGFYYSRLGGPSGAVNWGFSGAAFVVWAAGVLTATVVGPLLGAWVFRQQGIARTGDRLEVDVMTPGRR